MAGEIHRQKKIVRPSFEYSGPENGHSYSAAQCTAQMAESIRNICESQLALIERTNRLLQSIDRLIRRIDRRLSQVAEFKIKGGHEKN